MKNYSYTNFLKEINIYPIESHWKHTKITHGNILWDKDEEKRKTYKFLKDTIGGTKISGLYLYKIKDKVLYVGKAKSIYERTKQHFLESINPNPKKAFEWFSFFKKYNCELDLYFIEILKEEDRRAIERMLEADLSPEFETYRKNYKKL